MKKFLNLILLIGCFSLCIATSAEAQTQAQEQVVNNTSCEMVVTVTYGLGCDAAMTTSVSFILAPFGGIATIPVGEVILSASGYYTIGGPNKCSFKISRIDCIGGPPSQTVNCAPPCGNYTATFLLGRGVVIN